MLSELRALLASQPAGASRAELRAAVVDANVLLKKTLANRKKSYQRLRELYALDPSVLVYRALRELWDTDPLAQPLLALLSAVARDALLRATVAVVVSAKVGEGVTPYEMSAAAERAFPGRYSQQFIAGVGRHAASTWQQSGHLTGRLHKTRAEPMVRPPAVAFALLLGHLCGARGQSLLRSFWVQLLAAPEHVVREQARTAARQGWLEYRDAGGVVDVSFSFLMAGVVEERGA
jgi:hypothetical protein